MEISKLNRQKLSNVILTFKQPGDKTPLNSHRDFEKNSFSIAKKGNKRLKSISNRQKNDKIKNESQRRRYSYYDREQIPSPKIIERPKNYNENDKNASNNIKNRNISQSFFIQKIQSEPKHEPKSLRSTSEMNRDEKNLTQTSKKILLATIEDLKIQNNELNSKLEESHQGQIKINEKLSQKLKELSDFYLKVISSVESDLLKTIELNKKKLESLKIKLLTSQSLFKELEKQSIQKTI